MSSTPPREMSESLLRPAEEGLSLRVKSGPRAGQRLKILAPKCTIGAAAGCTLRLQGRGIRAVHCTILRGRERTVVRRWSLDTRLNGTAFEDSPLAPGDCLSVGPVDFEVLPADALTRDDEPQAKSTDISPPPSETDPDAVHQLEAAQREFEEQRRQWDDQRRRAQADLDRREACLEEQTADLTAERNRIQHLREEAEIPSSEFAQQQEQLTNDRIALDRQCDELDQQRAEFEQERAQLADERETIRREQQSLSELRESLSSQGQELETQRADLDRQREEHERVIERQQQSAADEMSARREALENEKEAVRVERESLESDRGALHAEREQLGAERNAWQQQQWQEEKDRSTGTTQQAADRAAAEEKTAEKSTLSTARFLSDNDDLADDLKETREVAEPRPTENVGQLPPPANDDEEESVDAYMQRLMNRVSGGSAAAETTHHAPAMKPKPAEAPPTEARHAAPRKQESAASVAEPNPEPADPAEPVVRRKKPEMPTNLEAMRDLANMTARRAIAKHQLRTDKHSMRTFLALAVGAIGSGLALLYMASAPGSRTFLAAMAAFCCGLYFTVQFLMGLRSRAAAIAWAKATPSNPDSAKPAQRNEPAPDTPAPPDA